MTDPVSHVDEAVKLQADGYVDLFEAQLNPSGIVRFKNDNQVSWQGHTYEALALQLGGVEMNGSDEESRPTLTIVNPKGMFSSFVLTGYLDKATIIRRRVLKQHIDSDTNLSVTRTWWVGRIAALNSQRISMELRDMTEGPNFLVPARLFMPPDFPVVTIR